MLTTWLSNAAGEIDLSETGIAAPGSIRPFIGGRLSNTLPRFGPNVGSPPHSRRSAKRCRRSQFDPNKEDQRMARKRFKPEEIVAKLRQIEVLQSQGMAVMDAINRRSSPTLHSDHLISISGTTREPS